MFFTITVLLNFEAPGKYSIRFCFLFFLFNVATVAVFFFSLHFILQFTNCINTFGMIYNHVFIIEIIDNLFYFILVYLLTQ